VALHYDFGRRTCTAHVLRYAEKLDLSSARCVYLPQYHVLVVDPGVGPPTYDPYPHHTLDLATGECFPQSSEDYAGRALRAWEDYPALRRHARGLSVINGGRPASSLMPPFLWLDPSTGELGVNDGINPRWPAFAFLAEGRPLFQGSHALAAQCSGPILLLKVARCTTHAGETLLLFRRPGELVAQHSLHRPGYAYALSPHGDYLAVQTGQGAVQVFGTGEGKPRFTVKAGRSPQRVSFQLYQSSLIINPGTRHYHIARWENGCLELTYSTNEPAPTRAGATPAARVLLGGPRRSVSSFDAIGLLPFVIACYKRFNYVVEADGLVAALDRFGQLSILDRNRNLVCMFLARRNQIGVWMPDGTRAGSAALTGGPPTPGALEKIGAALLRASQGGAPA
jgi:hypothetical protein